MKVYYNIHMIWFVMLILTLLSYSIGESNSSGTVAAIFLLITALTKGYFLINDFMELRDVSFLWRAIMFGWLWCVSLSLIGIYIFSV